MGKKDDFDMNSKETEGKAQKDLTTQDELGNKGVSKEEPVNKEDFLKLQSQIKTILADNAGKDAKISKLLATEKELEEFKTKGLSAEEQAKQYKLQLDQINAEREIEYEFKRNSLDYLDWQNILNEKTAMNKAKLLADKIKAIESKAKEEAIADFKKSFKQDLSENDRPTGQKTTFKAETNSFLEQAKIIKGIK